ncbi:hypothetical protein [Pseudonocardia sp. H11422]|uniref:hypothetical protein n=1 Tax=Pseudonocardia sp. H11422 TaxID=2835866 RepID=UPI001BDD73A8|nr:hypothetical protein [Pseudonocardia sp. H11422]
MARGRSYDDVVVGQQLYPVVESCRKPEVLWSKLASGNDDWLGVRRNGRFVLGRPRLAVPARPAPDLVDPPGEGGHHRIEYCGPLDDTPRQEWYADPDEARDAFARIITGGPITPLRSSGIWKVPLFVADEKVDDVLVVRRLTDVL